MVKFDRQQPDDACRLRVRSPVEAGEGEDVGARSEAIGDIVVLDDVIIVARRRGHGR